MSARYFEDSEHSKLYAKYRPKAPPNLIKAVVDYVKKMFDGDLNMAVDVGCGSGLNTICLASSFTSVIGVDISETQIKEANKSNNLKSVKYVVSCAEKLPFTDNSVQLITTGTAVHWFDIPSYFTECDRVLSPGGVLAIYAHLFPQPIWGNVSDELNELVLKIMNVDLGPYWPKEFEMIRSAYTTIEFPYSDGHRIDNFTREQTLTVSEFIGCIMSWSSFQGYKKCKGDNAAEKLITTFTGRFMKLLEASTTPEETKMVIKHSYFLLLGSKPK